MPTFVSMLTWYGDPQSPPCDVRAAVAANAAALRGAGLRSIFFLSDEGACAAVMIASCEDGDDVVRIAESICPGVGVRIESMQFDGAKTPAWIRREVPPPPPGDYLSAVFDAVATG